MNIKLKVRSKRRIKGYHHGSTTAPHHREVNVLVPWKAFKLPLFLLFLILLQVLVWVLHLQVPLISYAAVLPGKYHCCRLVLVCKVELQVGGGVAEINSAWCSIIIIGAWVAAEHPSICGGRRMRRKTEKGIGIEQIREVETKTA